MEPSTSEVTLTATTSPTPQIGGFDIFAQIGSMFGGGESVSGFFTTGGFFGFLSSLWTTFAIIAYIASIILLVFYIFASIRRTLYVGLMTQEIRDNEKLFAQQFAGQEKNSRLTDMLEHSTSNNPNDWKLAIIEADIILDEILKKKGYAGSSLGERLKGISADQLESIGDAWEAHKVRNKIAHQGADFVLTKRIVDETITRYQKVFNEFGVS